MDPAEIRKHVIIAVFSDDLLMEKLVLKGGNALELIHKIITRGSVDIDLSLQEDFDDLDNAKDRMHRALVRRFNSIGYTIFDYSFESIPPEYVVDKTPWWGGYKVEFKLISEEKQAALGGDLKSMQREAQVIDTMQGRRFRIELSKHEYCDGKMEIEYNDYMIYVYTAEMCALEKLRAICQQMPEYGPLRNKRPRGRDFYDIYAIIAKRGIDLALPENMTLCRYIFEAKKVPLSLLSQISETREYHRLDWEKVVISATEDVFDFDFYFDFVIGEIMKLKSLWDE
jgi:predicted nucleotidyltransferase component of viral defense system